MPEDGLARGGMRGPEVAGEPLPAVIGLTDPAHGPFGHASRWRRPRRSVPEKAKAFAPGEPDLTTLRHAPPSDSAAYRLLGGRVPPGIVSRPPGIRIGHIRGGRHAIVGPTAVTPIDAMRTRVRHAVCAATGRAGLVRPLIGRFAGNFLGRDRRIRHDPTLMSVGDADVRAEGRPFANPVRERHDRTARLRRSGFPSRVLPR